MYKLMHYWGLGNKDLMKHLRQQGIECYSPAQGPYDSLWDRSCKFWACLFGGTVGFGNQQYGFNDYYDNITLARPTDPKKLAEVTKTITEHPDYNSTYQMTIEYCKKINEQQETNPHIYYFAQRGSNSIPMPNGKHLAFPSPNCTIPGLFVGTMLPKETGGYPVDESWYANDGYVNVPGQSAPFNAPQADGNYDGMTFRLGIWYNMPVVKHDHVFWNGYSGSRREYFETWDRIIAVNRSLPDAD